MDEAARKGQKPEEGEKDGKAADDFGVDEAGFGPSGVGTVPAVEVRANNTSDDLQCTG